MLPTVAEVLALDVMRRGEPRVVAGTDRLGTLVRWVHAIELADAPRPPGAFRWPRPAPAT